MVVVMGLGPLEEEAPEKALRQGIMKWWRNEQEEWSREDLPERGVWGGGRGFGTRYAELVGNLLAVTKLTEPHFSLP